MPPPSPPIWRRRPVIVAGVALLGIVAVVGYVALTAGSGGRVERPAVAVTAWGTLGTPDVHSLAFDPSDARHLYFGHHNGLLESRDGGRTWRPTGLEAADAMNVRTGTGQTLQVAGHDVYLETADGGKTWQPVPNDLPGLDLHAFTVDPADPAHAWAYAVGFGLFESTDRGRHWEPRQPGDWPVLATFRSGGAMVLLGLSKVGLGQSDDGGRTWQPLGDPGDQVASLAVSPDGAVLVAGTTNGLVRSTDGGRTWQRTPFDRLALAIALAPSDPRVVAVVDKETRFYRSEDAGENWPGP